MKVSNVTHVNMCCTCLRATLDMVIKEKTKRHSSKSGSQSGPKEPARVKRQNVTLSLPEPLLRRFRVYAAERGESMTRLMTQAIQDALDDRGNREREKQLFLETLRTPPGRGAGDERDWTRDEIHDSLMGRA